MEVLRTEYPVQTLCEEWQPNGTWDFAFDDERVISRGLCSLPRRSVSLPVPAKLSGIGDSGTTLYTAGP